MSSVGYFDRGRGVCERRAAGRDGGVCRLAEGNEMIKLIRVA